MGPPLEPKDPIQEFQREVARNIDALAGARDMRDQSLEWLRATLPYRYSYNFSWLGRPIIQYPQDIVAVQELIWRVRPDLIIETGVAHGGSVVLSASMLALLDYCEARSGQGSDSAPCERRVIGVDIDIRPHNRAAIEAHPLGHKIDLIEGSSTATDVIAGVREQARHHDRIMVLLDSNHTHAHVLAELEAYAPLVNEGSYCVVFDTVIEQLDEDAFRDRPWGRGNNPMTAVQRYLSFLAAGERFGADGKKLDFEIDERIDAKLLVSVAPSGYLRRVGREQEG
jgi:cephalosporin hydroxylase